MTSPRKRRPRGKPPFAGTTSTQSSGLPKFERSNQRQRIERPHRQSLRVLCVTAKAAPPTVNMGQDFQRPHWVSSDPPIADAAAAPARDRCLDPTSIQAIGGRLLSIG